MCHSIQSEISYIGLLGENESTKKGGSSLNDRRFGIEMNGEVDSFEEDGVLSVVMLNIFGRSLGVLQNSLENVVENKAKGWIICKSLLRMDTLIGTRDTYLKEGSIVTNVEV